MRILDQMFSFFWQPFDRLPKIKKEVVRPRPIGSKMSKALEYECYSELVEIVRLREVLMKWHNSGFYPMEIKSLYVSNMPSDKVSVMFTKRKANLI